MLVYVSYSWDSNEYREKVKSFVDKLRSEGITVIFFDDDIKFGESTRDFMLNGIKTCDAVLCLLSPGYKEKAERNIGGVGFENAIITNEIFMRQKERTFIPILFSGTFQTATPSWLMDIMGVDLSSDRTYEENYNRLLSTLYKMENTKKEIKPLEFRDYFIERLTDNTNESKDIIAFMLKNNDETTDYFKISKRHAKISYVFSIIACSVGILFLLSSIIVAFLTENLQATIISAVAGAITEIIAGTVLWVHNKSALQLNHYYKALHENEKFLSTVTLVEKVSDNKRDDAYLEIIRSQFPNREDMK